MALAELTGAQSVPEPGEVAVFSLPSRERRGYGDRGGYGERGGGHHDRGGRSFERRPGTGGGYGERGARDERRGGFGSFAGRDERRPSGYQGRDRYERTERPARTDAPVRREGERTFGERGGRPFEARNDRNRSSYRGQGR